MLEVKIFAEGVTQKIKDYLPKELQDVQCEVMEQQKNNGLNLVGICFQQPGQKIAPIVYMESFYDKVRQGRDLDVVMKEIVTICSQALCAKDLPEQLDFEDYNSVKDYLKVQVINTKANQKMLSHMPRKKLEDLSVICRIEFPSPDGQGVGSAKVTNEILKKWEVSPEIVYQQALDNAEKVSPPVLMSMEGIMKEILDDEKTGENLLEPNSTGDIPKDMMYVLSNPERINGASVLAYPHLMEKVDALFPKGFYILPSSLHEVLVVPKEAGRSPKELGQMVREVNEQEVIQEEILSDRVYEYDKEKGKICQVVESIKEKEMER
ncbi:MAG: DUF5688 family protein [Muricomes sp.]